MRITNTPQDWREGRRRRGWELHQQGWSQTRIAEALGVSQSAVSQWISRGRAGGVEALQTRKPTGARRRLSDTQRARLLVLLKVGAQAYGFVGEIWTQDRVAVLIKREFGVRYHRDHIGRLLRELGWSVQKPLEQATQRDDMAVERWRRERWPEIQKKQNAKVEP